MDSHRKSISYDLLCILFCIHFFRSFFFLIRYSCSDIFCIEPYRLPVFFCHTKRITQNQFFCCIFFCVVPFGTPYILLLYDLNYLHIRSFSLYIPGILYHFQTLFLFGNTCKCDIFSEMPFLFLRLLFVYQDMICSKFLPCLMVFRNFYTIHFLFSSGNIFYFFLYCLMPLSIGVKSTLSASQTSQPPILNYSQSSFCPQSQQYLAQSNPTKYFPQFGQ